MVGKSGVGALQVLPPVVQALCWPTGSQSCCNGDGHQLRVKKRSPGRVRSGGRRARTHSGISDLVAIRDVGVGGDLLRDGSGCREGTETPESESGEKGDAEHSGLLLKIGSVEKILKQVLPVSIVVGKDDDLEDDGMDITGDCSSLYILLARDGMEHSTPYKVLKS